MNKQIYIAIVALKWKSYKTDKLMFLYLNIICYPLNKWTVESFDYYQIILKVKQLNTTNIYFLISFLKVRNQEVDLTVILNYPWWNFAT